MDGIGRLNHVNVRVLIQNGLTRHATPNIQVSAIHRSVRNLVHVPDLGEDWHPAVPPAC